MKLVEIMQRGKKVRVDTHNQSPSCGIRWNRDHQPGYRDNSRYLGTIDMIDIVTQKHYQIQVDQVQWETIREGLDKAFADAPRVNNRQHPDGYSVSRAIGNVREEEVTHSYNVAVCFRMDRGMFERIQKYCIAKKLSFAAACRVLTDASLDDWQQ